jgi:hypothetical protein
MSPRDYCVYLYLCIPLCYNFQPTQEELLHRYLNPWVTTSGQADFHDVVCTSDIYAADPDTLTSQFTCHDHGGNWDFLCILWWKDENKNGEAGRRMNHHVRGGGTWHSSAKWKPIGAERDTGMGSSTAR